MVRADREGTGRRLRNASYPEWIAERSTLGVRDACDAVVQAIAEIEAEPPEQRHARAESRSRVSRQDVAEALLGYYGTPAVSHPRALRFYAATVGRESPVQSTVLTRPGWLDATFELGTPAERTRFDVDSRGDDPGPFDPVGARAALRRLAEIETNDVVLVNNPLYRLVDLDVRADGFDARFTLSDFLTYALRNDLLEVELLDAIGDGTRSAPDAAASNRLQLRDRYLPDIGHALDLEARHCVGGIDALVAAARHDENDYVLLVQQRSARVLNLAGRLAVIPKAFHQPIGEPDRETAPSDTVKRELEEELLGRADLETPADMRPPDPGHVADRAEPARYDPDGVRLWSTGFGINMVTGNYVFAGLIVIDDPRWWRTFGQRVGTNWESEGLRRYSSRDTRGLAELASDPSWSNESLFAFIRGLRRLGEVGDVGRLDLPTVEESR